MKKFVLGLFISCVFILAIGCASLGKSSYSDGDAWIPLDFNPAKTTLLIETHPRNAKQNVRMIEFLTKEYSYPYEVVDKNVIDSKTGKYADTKKYQFAVDWTFESSNRTRLGADGKYSSSTEKDLYGSFIDRSTNKTYPTTTKYNNYGQDGYKPFIKTVTKKFK